VVGSLYRVHKIHIKVKLLLRWS